MTTTVAVTEPGTAGSAGSVPRNARRGVPARVRIMGWLILLMTVVLLSVVVVSRNLLLQGVEAAVNTALEQETREFSGVAASGVDRATGRPFQNITELLHNHLQRQFPDDDEVLVGAVRTRADGRFILHLLRLLGLFACRAMWVWRLAVGRWPGFPRPRGCT
ncbi:MAG: hypothetical protein ACRDTB_35655, partial [Actinophytocola sp.]